MKVLLINGSPHKNGNTHAALTKVEAVLKASQVETEIVHIGTAPIRGCIDCKKCADSFRCIFKDDVCNELIEAFIKADGIIIGTPVYFAGPNGALCALLDRVFYAGSSYGGLFAGKPAAALATCARAGSTAALDRLNKYFTFSQMPIVSSCYWNMVYDPNTGDVSDDKFGEEILRVLGKNIAEMLSRK